MDLPTLAGKPNRRGRRLSWVGISILPCRGLKVQKIVIGILRILLDKLDRKGDSFVGATLTALSRRGVRAMPYELDRRFSSHNSYLPLVAMMPAVPVPSTCTPAFDGGIPSCGPWTAVYRLAYEQARAALAPSRFQELIKPTWN